MTENKVKSKPDYKSQGVAVWKNVKEGKEYLSIKIVGHNTFYAFPNEDQEEKKPDSE